MTIRWATSRLERPIGLFRLDARTWLRAAVLAVISGLLIALPTRLIPNGWFSRMTPTRPQDYVFWIVGSVLIGLALALRNPRSRRGETQAVQAVGGGFGTVLAVGCPICNKLVVALLGVSGALNVFAPLQPLLGIASIGLLGVGVRNGLRSRTADSCAAGVGNAAREGRTD